jgi:hypothetical protein
MSDSGMGKASMELFVSFIRGIEEYLSGGVTYMSNR